MTREEFNAKLEKLEWLAQKRLLQYFDKTPPVKLLRGPHLEDDTT